MRRCSNCGQPILPSLIVGNAMAWNHLRADGDVWPWCWDVGRGVDGAILGVEALAEP